MRVHRLDPQRGGSLSSRTASEDSEFGNQSDRGDPHIVPQLDCARRVAHPDSLQLTRLALARLTPAPPTQLHIHVRAWLIGETNTSYNLFRPGRPSSICVTKSTQHSRSRSGRRFGFSWVTRANSYYQSAITSADSSISYLIAYDRPTCSYALSGWPLTTSLCPTTANFLSV